MTMQPARALRLATITHIALMVVMIPIAFAEVSGSPDSQQTSDDMPILSTIAAIIGLISIAGVIVSDIGLLLSKTWGARLHLYSLVVGTVAVAFMGSQTTYPVGDAIGTSCSVVSALIIGLAFFTDAIRQSEPEEQS